MQVENKRALCALLALSSEASDSAILDKAKALTADSTRTTELCTQLKTELADATKRASAAEAELKAQEAQAFAADVKACLDKACTEGRVKPAKRKGWEDFCLKSPEHFAQFKDQVLPDLPIVGDPAPESSPAPTARPSRSLFGFSQEKLDKARAYIEARNTEDDDDHPEA